jgi:hypothetical protein
LVALLGGCDWATFMGGIARTGYQAGENAISAANVGTLSLQRSYPAAESPPVVANGTLYEVGSDGYLWAYDATGAHGCMGSPASCSPLWKAPVGGGSTGITVANNVVYVVNVDVVWGFDAAGSSHCTNATPRVCSPIWETAIPLALPTTSGGPVTPISAAVVNGVLYVAGRGNGGIPSQGAAYVLAYDTTGHNSCTGSAPTVCSPLWTSDGAPTSVPGGHGAVAVANGVVYVASSNNLRAYDATRSSRFCNSATPSVCLPIWTATLPPGARIGGSPSVGAGAVFVANENDGKLYAFDASAGSATCTTASPKVCSPLWTSANIHAASTPAIAYGDVYVLTGSGPVAFAAAGTKLWAFNGSFTAGTGLGSMAIANGVLYFTDVAGTLSAVDATGQSCTGTLRTCSALWSVKNGLGAGDPAVVNGILYTNQYNVNDVRAYALP